MAHQGVEDIAMAFKTQRITYPEVAKLGDLILDVYHRHGITLQSGSSILRYIASAKLMLSKWQAGEQTFKPRECASTLEESLECLRIGSAIRWLENKPNLKDKLKRLLQGTVDPTQKARTEAKDYLFELNLAARLESAGIDSSLVEPDIMLDLSGAKLAVACKCVYSARNLESQVRKAVAQILKAGEKGIIALSIDAQLKQSQLTSVPTEAEHYRRVANQAKHFLNLNRARVCKHVGVRKDVIGLLLSASTLSLVQDIRLPQEGSYLLLNNLCSEHDPEIGLIKTLHSRLGAMSF